MRLVRNTTFTLALVAVALLPACSRPAADQAKAEAETEGSRGYIARAIDKEIAKARKELHEGNLVISGDHDVKVAVDGWSVQTSSKADATRPRAEISPQGDLLVEGKAVAVTPAQRKLLLGYRAQVIQVADTGLEIGSKGADLAGEAIGQALGALFSGDTKEMERRVEARAEQLKQEARAICGQLPAMLATQQRLAASLPAFRPYATLEQADIDDCMDEVEKDDKGE
jgi:hypothetical protein